MNIAIISNFSNFMKESINITTFEFAKELKRLGNNVFIVSNAGKEKRYKEVEGVKIFIEGKRRNKSFLNPIYIYEQLFIHKKIIQKILKKERIDIIHHFSASPILLLRALIAKAGLKQIKLIHTMKSYSQNKFGNLFYKILNNADMITVSTEIMKKRLISKNILGNKINVIRSYIDIKKFKVLNKDKLKIKYSYGKKRIIFYYGSLYEQKGVKYLLKAMPKVIRDNKDVVLIIAPRSGKFYNKEYDAMIKNLGITKNLKIITEDINVVDYLNLSDLLVLPYSSLTRTEGNPSCLLEAIACKTPVVTTDFPELREIVTPEQDVLMAKPRDVVSLAENINRLLKDKKLQKKLVENAYKKSKEFDVKIITKQFIKLYEELLNGS